MTPSTGNPQGLTSPRTITSDVLSSVVVFFVAVPLALGISISSGAPSVVPGLIACIIGGVVVGALGGAPLQVTGPAAGLTVITYDIIQKFGWQGMCAVTAAAGLVQILTGYLRIGKVCLAIAPAVVHGMLAGIGVVIALAQVHVVLGGSPQSSALKNLADLPAQLLDLHGASTFIGLFTIGILFLWRHLPAPLSRVPAALAAVLLGTASAIITGAGVRTIDLPDTIFQAISFPSIPSDLGGFALAVFTVALVASVESLLCAVATDKLHTGPRADLNRELVGQGVANTMCGIFGALPVTGVIVRSSANISSGAKTRLSAILHGIWILAFIVFCAPLLETIPLATLAGLLVFVGIQLVNAHHLRELITHAETITYGVTLGGVVCFDLLTGVGLGIGVSLIRLLGKLSRLHVEVSERGGRWHVRMEGTATVLTVPKMMEYLGKIPAGASVDVDLMVQFMDHAAFDALHSWRVSHEKIGGSVDIDELHEEWYLSAASGAPVGPHSSSKPMVPMAFKERGQIEGRSIRELHRGARRFNRHVSGKTEEGYLTLGNGQQPRALFITCADSRVVPNLMTMSSPGDLFTVRNVGNFVPCWTRTNEGATYRGGVSMVAAVEYAVNVLTVSDIIVCGHSECGAMRALLDPTFTRDESALSSWLSLGDASVERLKQGDRVGECSTDHDHLAQLNVLTQLEHLRAYPALKDRVETGAVRLWGWFFSVQTAEVYAYNETSQRFERVGREHGEELPWAVGAR
jgi:carbonic anhydrase